VALASHAARAAIAGGDPRRTWARELRPRVPDDRRT
jgi:hypothetical protein